MRKSYRRALFVAHGEGRELKDRFHGVGCERVICLQDQSDRSAHDGCRHARPTEPQIGVVDSEGRMVHVERARLRSGRDETMPRSDEIRFGPGVVPRRSTRAVIRDAVVAAQVRVECPGRSDRDGRRRITWRKDARVARLSGRRRHAEVAGRRNNDDAGAYGCFYCLDERVCGRRLENRMAQREVDDVDAQPRLVPGHEFDGADHVTGVARPFSSRTFSTMSRAFGATPR